jgi:hypothetical protein
VTDSQGKPVAHAWVRAEAPRAFDPALIWRPSSRRAAFTDANGMAALSRTRDEVLTVHAAAAGYLQGAETNVRGSSAAVRLAAGAARTIEVRDRQGKTVEGVFVTLSESDWLAGRTPVSGRLDLAVPAAGVALRLATADGRRLSYRLRAAKPGETGPAVIVLRPAAPARGRIVAAGGRPLAGALAWLSGDAGAAVRSGQDGGFQIPDLPEEPTDLFAAAPGYFDGEGSTSAEIRLDPTQGITIDALLPNGQPPDRIRVAAVDAAGRTVSTGTYPTGENGRAKVSEVPAGSWLLLVESDQSAPVTLQVTVPGPALRALLPPAGQLHIGVPALANDAATAKIVLTGSGGLYRAIDWDGSVKSEWELGGGAFSFSRVPAGVWQVKARTVDGRSWSGTATVTPGGAAEVVLK